MPSWCTVYKGLVTLLVFLILIEYFFGTIEYKRWESVFQFNSSRVNLEEVQHFHSPLLKSPMNLGKNKAVLTDTEEVKHLINITLNYNSSTLLNNTSNITNSSQDMVQTMNSTQEHSRVSNFTELPLCPDTPPGLGTRIKVVKHPVPTVAELEERFSWLKMGGHGQPENCQQLNKIALIIPFRCRAEHLLLFLQHMHPFLRKQQIHYTIFVIEQDGSTPFNRASLMNVGFKEALKSDDFDCFIFHDIDLLPEDERNLYTCPITPRHMSVAVDLFSYKLPYLSIFGGVSAITKEHFQLLNGFSNSFWGWGGEDDDMSNRISYHNLQISRYPESIARYTMLMHKKERANPERYEALKAGKQKYDIDGLSNLHYRLKETKRNLLYTWILVEIGPRS